ncbi:hypothetical protein E4U21_005603 [Claviceps maximensis]|nr:hypothetical protein E4U21_005603 [Claviceps maximensis]
MPLPLPIRLLLLAAATSTLSCPPINAQPPKTDAENISITDTISHRPASQIIRQLNLVPNAERGYFAEMFQDPETACAACANRTACVAPASASASNRSVSTSIYYLLEGRDSPSRWHRVDATEVWHYYAGAPLTLSLSRDDGAPLLQRVLGQDIFAGEAPQVVVPRGVWQRAWSEGEWTLVGTTVSPGFTASGFELAPPEWNPRVSC